MKNNQTPAQIWRAFLANESPELATVAKAVKNQMGLPLADVLENLYSISRHSIALANSATKIISTPLTCKPCAARY